MCSVSQRELTPIFAVEKFWLIYYKWCQQGAWKAVQKVFKISNLSMAYKQEVL